MFFFCTTSTLPNKIVRPPEIPEESLLLRISSGDREALASLYRQTCSAVYGFILSILKNRHDAEDAMQDVYLKIAVSAAGYRPRGKPLAWILTIARNIALMRLREQKRTVPAEPSELESSSEVTNLINEDSLFLREALRILGEEERQILILHAVVGLKHREIAEILKLPLPTVLSKYSRSLSKLKKSLNGGEEI